MKTMKQAVAIILAFVVLATCIEIPLTVQATDTPESGSWTSSGATVTQLSDQVLQITKNSSAERVTVTNSATYLIETNEAQSDFELQWNMDYCSKNSDTTVQLNLTTYNEAGEQLESIAGDRVMLSRESEYSGWEQLVTIATVPKETKKVSYQIVLVGDKADLQVKNISAMVAEDIVKSDKSSVTGWTAQEVWYPENEEKDCKNQFRYFRIRVAMEEPLKSGTNLHLQLKADDSFSLMRETSDGNQQLRFNTFWVNERFVSDSRGTTIREYGNNVLSYSIAVDDYGLDDTSEFYICIRVLNVSVKAGLILQAYGVPASETQSWDYVKIAETNATTTQTSKLHMSGSCNYATYKEPETEYWYLNDYTPTDGVTWVSVEERGKVPYGNLGDVPFDWRYSDSPGFECADEALVTKLSVQAGSNVSVTKTLQGVGMEGSARVKLYNTADETQVIATIPTVVISNEESVEFSFDVPDYIPSATYKVCLEQARYLIADTEVTDNLLATLTVTASEQTPVDANVITTEKGVRLQIDGENVSPILYVQSGNDSSYCYDTTVSFQESGVGLYTNFSGRLSNIWKEDGTIDTSVLDKSVYRTLDLNPNAMLLINLTMTAPAWWMTANSSELMVGTNGKTVQQVSFASTKYREESSTVLAVIIEHLANSSYKHRICGIRISGGETSEWMHFTDSNGYIGDYSEPMRKYYQERYNTTEELPTKDDRKSGQYGILLDVAKQQAVLNYNECLAQCITDSLQAYAKTAKETMQSESVTWIVGGYNGYLWMENTAGGIGRIHSTCEELLDSKYIDFFSSPVNYNERISGYATSYMTLPESIMAHGKLYIAEQDNRTVYTDYDVVNGQTDALGKTYTMEDTVAQIKRDGVSDLVKGNGFWFYDMEGGWFDDRAITEAIQSIKAEYDYANTLDTSTNSEVAVFLGSETYDYLANDSLQSGVNDSYRILSQLYARQRIELSRMGTSYDTYMIEDLCNTSASVDWSQYKLCIMLSPFELTSTERAAIREKLQINGNYVLWVYMPGISDGSTMSAEHISDITGVTVQLATTSSYTTIEAEVQSSLWGMEGNTYGITQDSSTISVRIPYINDSKATTLANYPYLPGMDCSINYKTAVAMKSITNSDHSSYVSVYSAVPCVTADSLRALCAQAGVHTYVADKDSVVETNESYISIYSQVGGEKTVSLPKGYAVYDVFAGEYVEVDNSQFTATFTPDETKLYRLTPFLDIQMGAWLMKVNDTSHAFKTNLTQENISTEYAFQIFISNDIAINGETGIVNATWLYNDGPLRVLYTKYEKVNGTYVASKSVYQPKDGDVLEIPEGCQFIQTSDSAKGLNVVAGAIYIYDADNVKWIKMTAYEKVEINKYWFANGATPIIYTQNSTHQNSNLAGKTFVVDDIMVSGERGVRNKVTFYSDNPAFYVSGRSLSDGDVITIPAGAQGYSTDGTYMYFVNGFTCTYKYDGSTHSFTQGTYNYDIQITDYLMSHASYGFRLDTDLSNDVLAYFDKNGTDTGLAGDAFELYQNGEKVGSITYGSIVPYIKNGMSYIDFQNGSYDGVSPQDGTVLVIPKGTILRSTWNVKIGFCITEEYRLYYYNRGWHEQMYGDADGDRSVTVKDVARYKKWLSNCTDATIVAPNEQMDFNNDRVADEKDTPKLFTYILKQMK